MDYIEKKELKESYDGPGTLLGMGSFQFDELKAINFEANTQRSNWGVPLGVDYEISLTMGATKQPKNVEILKVGSGTLESLNLDRSYGLNIYFSPKHNRFTLEFYEERNK